MPTYTFDTDDLPTPSAQDIWALYQFFYVQTHSLPRGEECERLRETFRIVMTFWDNGHRAPGPTPAELLVEYFNKGQAELHQFEAIVSDITDLPAEEDQ